MTTTISNIMAFLALVGTIVLSVNAMLGGVAWPVVGYVTLVATLYFAVDVMIEYFKDNNFPDWDGM